MFYKLFCKWVPTWAGLMLIQEMKDALLLMFEELVEAMLIWSDLEEVFCVEPVDLVWKIMESAPQQFGEGGPSRLVHQ